MEGEVGEGAMTKHLAGPAQPKPRHMPLIIRPPTLTLINDGLGSTSGPKQLWIAHRAEVVPAITDVRIRLRLRFNAHNSRAPQAITGVFARLL